MHLSSFERHGLSASGRPLEALRSVDNRHLGLKRSWSQSVEDSLLEELNGRGGRATKSPFIPNIDTLNRCFTGGPQPYFTNANIGHPFRVINGSDTKSGIRNCTHTSLVDRQSSIMDGTNDGSTGLLLFSDVVYDNKHRSRFSDCINFTTPSTINQNSYQMPLTDQPQSPSLFTRYHFGGVSIGMTQPSIGRERGASITHVVAGDAVTKNYWEGLEGGYTSGTHLWFIVVSRDERNNNKNQATQQLIPAVVLGPGRPTIDDINKAIRKHPDYDKKGEIKLTFTGRAIQIGTIVQPMGLARFPLRMGSVVNVALGLGQKTNTEQQAAFHRLHDVRIAVSIKYM
jgi:hypothetical protein